MEIIKFVIGLLMFSRGVILVVVKDGYDCFIGSYIFD